MSTTIAHVSITLPPEPMTIKDRETQSRRRSIIQEFFMNTSAHALPGIARSESLHNRVFWSISFISFTGIMIYFVVKAITAYFEYPTQFDISFAEEWPQYFPAFSLCNASPLSLDRFLQPFLDYTKTLNVSISNDTTTWSSGYAIYIRNFVIEKLNRNESLVPFYSPFSSVLYSCTFNSVPCSEANFTSFVSSSMGICYTFNAKLKNNYNDIVRYANQHGGEGILDLGLYIHSHQAVPYIRDGSGVVSLVHDNTQVPLVETAGIHLATGRKHKLGYRKKVILFQPSPYTKCTNKISPSMEAMFEYYNGADYEYSATICLQLCRQTFIYEQCGCINPQLATFRSVINRTTNQVFIARLCDRNNSCYGKAVDQLLNSPALLDTYCSNCSEQCSITDFIIQTSSLTAPVQWQRNSIKRFVENSAVPLPVDWSTAWSTYITESYVSISIVREITIVENNTQIATIGLVDVLSNIGGQTGLWIGISFLSIMELIEMLYRLLRYEYHNIRLAIQRKKAVSS